ncbi:hypothetical protein EV702DRAFT_1042632 [Suillus placidus]|uniref:Uncharacterized protein n=1 Tax=Suillus placidus TaxID=48579 RepID=A0A9P7A1Z2_9AGAM|nr:hypothetical protein EV702DRAFT_1042632 [Suillus placidus]
MNSLMGGRISIDSYGQVVGSFSDDEIPDFVVSSAGSELDRDVPFLIFEVKRDDGQSCNSRWLVMICIVFYRDFMTASSPVSFKEATTQLDPSVREVLKMSIQGGC